MKLVRATFQNIPGVILVTTTADMGSHLGVDGDILAVTGYTTAEFVTLNPMCDFLSPKADRVEVTALFETMVDPQQPFVETDIPYLHKDGHTIWLRVCHGSRLIGTTTDGKPKILAVLSDVTATVLAQREALDMRDALMRRMEIRCFHKFK